VRIDVVSIFPDYLAPLSLSLPGRARRTGLLDLRVHDLRAWTHDRHRTVDDTPYGGGAGMVMRPEPWGEALDELVPEADGAVLVVPTPAGGLLDQATAKELAAAKVKSEVKADVNAAESCRAARKADADAFAEKYGSKRNAFGKCVSRTAKALQDESDDSGPDS
jgi:hypothetical protein